MIVWTDYMQYRAELRGYDLDIIGNILKTSSERYVDTVTGRYIAIGHHKKQLVMIPYEQDKYGITPVTIHPSSRQQINFRIKAGRIKYE